MKFTEKDRLFAIQFSFPNRDAVPMGLWALEDEDEEMKEKREKRKQAPSGVDLLNGQYPSKTSLSDLPITLVKNGFVMITAKYQKRIDAKNSNATYNMVRFVFLRKKYEDRENEKLQEFLRFRGLLMTQFQEICSLALWRVRIYRNPYFETQNDELILTSDFAISINLEARNPLFERSTPALTIIPESKPEFKLYLGINAIQLRKV